MVEEDRVCREQGHRGQRDATGDCGGSQKLQRVGGGGDPRAEGSGRMKNLAQRPSSHLVHSMVEGQRQ